VCGRELPDRAAMGTTVICHNVPWVARQSNLDDCEKCRVMVSNLDGCRD